jgi:hypothetical protein
MRPVAWFLDSVIFVHKAVNPNLSLVYWHMLIWKNLLPLWNYLLRAIKMCFSSNTYQSVCFLIHGYKFSDNSNDE